MIEDPKTDKQAAPDAVTAAIDELIEELETAYTMDGARPTSVIAVIHRAEVARAAHAAQVKALEAADVLALDAARLCALQPSLDAGKYRIGATLAAYRAARSQADPS